MSDKVELILNPQTFEKFSSFIKNETGIYMKEQKISLLSNRLKKRLRALKLDSFEEYWSILQRRNNSLELKKFYDIISTNETYFQRGISHFKILARYLLPKLFNKTPIIIWSAGCSTGEEAYDLVIILLEFLSQNEKDYSNNPALQFKNRFKIIATDISEEVLKTAEEAKYADRKIAKLPPHIVTKYFEQIEKDASTLPFAKKILRVNPEVKQFVSFSQLNLVKDTFPNEIDVIFCRNVLIYFESQTQNNIVGNFYRSLKKVGYLFIGHSETMHLIESNFTVKRYSEGVVSTKNET